MYKRRNNSNSGKHLSISLTLGSTTSGRRKVEGVEHELGFENFDGNFEVCHKLFVFNLTVSIPVCCHCHGWQSFLAHLHSRFSQAFYVLPNGQKTSVFIVILFKQLQTVIHGLRIHQITWTRHKWASCQCLFSQTSRYKRQSLSHVSRPRSNTRWSSS